MQKVWEWLLDKKTNTLRKWRSSMIRRQPSNGSNDEFPASRRKSNKKSYSTGNIGCPTVSTTSAETTSTRNPSYDNFFDEPGVKIVLDTRRESYRNSVSVETFPVAPPDILVPERRPTPKPSRSPKQLRFNIPEVVVAFEWEEPRRVSFEERVASTSLVPPPEIDWASEMPLQRMQTIGEMTSSSLDSPLVVFQPSLSYDEEMTVSSRRNSASEKARQQLIAQRRQSNVQLVQTITGRRTSTTLIPLTCAQIHLVRSLWRQVYTSKGPTVIGSSIYHRLCFKCQTVKDQMKRVPVPPKFSNPDSFVKAHSKAVAELIDQVVENLDNLDSMVDELMRVGRVHARLLRGELTGKLWNTVAETIIDCTLEWGDKRCRSETVRKAWALIVAFVIEKIKLGHHEQRKLLLATRQSVSSVDIPLNSVRL